MYLMLRTDSFAKLFFFLTSTGLLLYIILAFYTYHTAFLNVSRMQKYQIKQSMQHPSLNMEIANRIKYILLWKSQNNTSNNFSGIFPFIDNKCPYTNCYLTNNRNLLQEDYRNFDAIVFDAEELRDWKNNNLPLKRLKKQKYIFYSTVPSTNITICNVNADEYFNLTCTFKLDSDIVIPFIEVFDANGNLVAPKDKVKWERDTSTLSKEHAKLFSNKTKTMAWVVERCGPDNKVMLFAKRLQAAFKESNLVFDIFGCDFKKCPGGNCASILHNYYFYFAVEDSDVEDYVTSEVVRAYNAFAVPIVKGDTNYQKFLPIGSYVNIGKGSLDKVVATVQYIARNPAVLYTFHRWRKYYHVQVTNPFEGFCKICEYLNDDEMVTKRSIKTNFRKWWYKGPLSERCVSKSAEITSDVLSNTNETRIYEQRDRSFEK